MNWNTLISYDFETGSADAETCQILQIAGYAIHSKNLKVTDSFSSYVRPDWDAEGITDDTLKFHAENKGITVDEFKDMLNEAPPIEVVWPAWTAWVDEFNWSKGNKTAYKAPIPAGYNIIGFDNIISSRYCLKLGPTNKDKRTGRQEQRLFSGVYSFDIMLHAWFWFENVKEIPNLKLTTLLSYMGVSDEVIDGAHNAEFDAEWCGKILIKLFKMQRYMTGLTINKDGKESRRLEFKDCFK